MPVRSATLAPGEFATEVRGFLVRHRQLQNERAALVVERARLRRELDSLRDTRRENAELRRLLGLSAQTQVVGVAAEIMQRGRGWFAQSISLDRGANAGVRPGQAIVDGEGLIGQIVRVFADASEGVLLTQAGQLTPVYVERTGQRGLTAGEGAGRLELRYIPQHADLKVGDRLLTSGLDRVYPPGVPVARVIRVARPQNTPYLRVECVPLGGVEKSRVVRIIQGVRP